MRGPSLCLLSLALVLAACAEGTPASLVLRLDSDLVIGEETNSLVVRVRPDGAPPEEASYPLGDGARSTWPQTLPIVAGQRPPMVVGLELELRWATPGVPSVVVGYRELSLPFPADRSEQVEVRIGRSCVDADGDGYGVGFGCDKPDCDDEDRDVPALRFCGVPADAGAPDGGTSPDGGDPEDAGLDAGVDGGVEEQDAGARDAEVSDTGTPPDAGGAPLCDGEVCEADEVCFMDQCRQSCRSNRDCDGVQLACLQEYGVCICRVPCRDSNTCGPFQCIDGCCQLPF